MEPRESLEVGNQRSGRLNIESKFSVFPIH